MPAEFDRMVDAIKKSLRKQYPKMKEDELTSRAYAIATAQWKKSHGGKPPSREALKDWRILEYLCPIEEKIFDENNDEFIIKGIAINETTTLNNVKYVAEELEKAAPTFRNVPILLDHKNEVKNIVGRTTDRVNFERGPDGIGRIPFEGKIMDKEIRQMIKDGRIQNVSIGAKVDDLIEEADGTKKAVGIKGLEISLVAVPGDSQASLAQAINHNLYLKEIANIDENIEVTDEEILELAKNMIKEFDKKTKFDKPEEKMEEGTAKEKEVAESKPIEKKVDVSDMQKQIDELKSLIVSSFSDMKKLQEEMKAEKKEMKDETKGIVSTEKVETKENDDGFVLEKAEKGFSLYNDYSKNPKLKRLKRL
jgi:hypothetical protein